MLDQEALLDLIGTLHAGAAEQDSWNEALDKLCDAMGGSALLLGTAPHSFGHCSFSGVRVQPEAVALINGPLATREANPVFRSVPRSAVHRPVIVSERLPARELMKSRLYSDVLKPSGILHTMAVLLASDQREALTLALGRSAGAGDYEPGEARLLGCLSPHIRSALAIRRELAIARSSASLLDALDRGLVLTSADGRIHFANAEAERIFRAQDGLYGAAGGLRAARSEDSRALRALIFEAGTASSGQGLRAGGAIAVERISAAMPYVVHVIPARLPALGGCGVAADAGAAVFIRDPDRHSRPDAAQLQSLYGFTRAEAELALRLYEGDALVQAAERLQVSANTAKTHLKAIFAKVGVTRQSALIRHLSSAFGDLRLSQPD